MPAAVEPAAPLVRPIGPPRGRYRSSVRDPLDPMIYLPVLIPSDDDSVVRAELVMTVPQAIELIGDYVREIGDFCKRADVRDALLRTEGGSVFACGR